MRRARNNVLREEMVKMEIRKADTSDHTNKELPKILSLIEQLNSEGKEMATEFLEYLVSTGEYHV